MSEVFNIKRFWNYFVTDTRNAWNNYGISLLLVAFMPLISFLLVELTSLVGTGTLTDYEMPGKVAIAYICIFVVMLTFPTKHYGHITDKRFGSDFVLLPASVFEKTLSLFVVSCVVLPLAFFLISGGVDLILSTIPVYGESLISGIVQPTDGKVYFDGKDITNLDYSAPQTLKGGPLRMRGTWVSGTEYFDGTVATSDGVMYQDVVVYNNVYYVCLNSEELRKNNWLSTPSSVSYWQQIAFSDSFISEYLIANKGFIKELSSEEVVIIDNDEIVAGMTSSKAIDSNSDLNENTNKGDVRIWAGRMRNANDLTSAPFTVTNAGVLKCQGTSGNSITLKDGTIWFVVNGKTYHLGITNDKPDWINSDAADSTETWYQKRGSDTNLSFSLVGAFAIKDNKYYTDATMKTPVSGTYYKKIHAGALLYNVESYTYLTYGSIFGVEIYNKASFTNGSKISNGIVAITGAVSVQTIPSENGGTLNVDTSNKTWAKISRVDKPTGSFTYYIADQRNSSSDPVPYTNIKSDNITFNYNTNNGIYVISVSDTESPNLSSMLSSWTLNFGTGSSDKVYEIKNNDLI